MDPKRPVRRASVSRPPARRRRRSLPPGLASGIRKRTNSLGWASSDCHACTAMNRFCDRTRPYCDQCTFRGLGCNGYVVELCWQEGVASRGRMRGQQLTVDSCTFVPQARNGGAYIFVPEHGRGERTSISGRKTRAQHKPAEVATPVQTPVTGGVEKREGSRTSVTETAAGSPLKREQSHDSGRNKDAVATRDQPICSARSPAALPKSTYSIYDLPPQVSELLEFYECQFARTTITCDLKVNPWQSLIPMVFSIDCLKHAVTAVSRRHQAHCQNDPEGDLVSASQQKALQAFSFAMRSTPVEPLIATSLTFIGLDYAETGFSRWTTHLRGAREILEAKGGLYSAISSSMLRCQIAMLLWWDITAALLSMHVPVFPERYLTQVLSWSTQYPHEWNYMSLNGCPDSLLPAMYRLASNAPFAGDLSYRNISEIELYVSRIDLETPEERTASDSAGVKPDGEEVSSNPGFHMTASLYRPGSVDRSLLAQANFPESTDRSANLVKCWQLAMLLYIRQVFYSPNQYAGTCQEDAQKQAERRRSLSKDIIGLISDMPPESNWQKQCLLPVVLAGFELRPQTAVGARHVSDVGVSRGSDDITSLREWVTSYCVRWKKLTGLWVFGTAADLLLRLWGRMDSSTIDSMTPSARYEALHNQFSDISLSQYGQTSTTYNHEVWWGDLIAEDIRKSEEEAMRERVGRHALYPCSYLFG